MKSIITKERFLVALYLIVSIILLLLSSHFYSDRRNKFFVLISNPTFEGEVVDMRAIWRGGFTLSTGYMEYRLYIVGEYLYNEEVIQVDRFFIVSRSLYERFDIGDLISWQTICKKMI